MIDISPDHLKIVLSILSKHVPDYEVWVFGSRVGRCPKKHSDLDLVIKTDSPVPVKTLAQLREAFSESDLPFKLDVVVWAGISESFRKIIQEKFEIIQKSTSA